MLGLYVSDHPLLGLEDALLNQTEFSTTELKEQKDGTTGWIGGIITKITKINTKKGDLMLFLNIEDLDGSVEVVVFPGTVEKYKDLIEVDKIVLVKGRLDVKEDEVKVLAQEVKAFNAESKGNGSIRRKAKQNGNGNINGIAGVGGKAKPGGAPKTIKNPVLVITVSKSLMTAKFVERLKDILKSHPGPAPVFLKVVNGGNPTLLALSEEFKVTPQNGIFAELMELAGENAAEIVDGGSRRPI